MAFENKPFFSTLGEFEFRPTYTFWYYPSVANLAGDFRSYNNEVDLNLGLRFLPNWEMQLEGDFLKTSQKDFGMEALAGQVRYQVLDDLLGDVVSLVSGVRIRYVPSRFLRDLSCPYAATMNFDLVTSVGREFDAGENWLFRLWSYLGMGIGNRGAPYFNPEVHFTAHLFRRMEVDLFALGQFGFGGRRVAVGQFGYANVNHDSIDIGGLLKYHFDIWGALFAAYAYRPYAHNFPERVQSIIVGYQLPFSLF